MPHQNFNLGNDNYNSSPDSNSLSGQSRSLNSSSGNESPAENLPSSFSPTIKAEAVNAPCFNPNSAVFKPSFSNVPTQESQNEAESK